MIFRLSHLLEHMGSSDPKTREAAWRQFDAFHWPLLYGWARRFGCQPSDASDRIQEVFLLLHEKLPKFEFRCENRFYRWLHTVLRNKCLMAYRRRTEVPRDDNEANEESPVVPDFTDEMAERDFRAHLLRKVAEAEQRLRPEFQPATWKAYHRHGREGRSAAEVAKEMGTSEVAVRKAKSRVVRRLREELKGQPS